jgi:hypothetical protein
MCVLRIMYVVCYGLLDCDAMYFCRWLPTFCSEDRGNMFLQNVGNHLQDYMVPQHKRPLDCHENLKSQAMDVVCSTLFYWNYAQRLHIHDLL